ncbi:MAG: hypothetical protein NVS3B10_07010 [Polyangiales bacterium]
MWIALCASLPMCSSEPSTADGVTDASDDTTHGSDADARDSNVPPTDAPDAGRLDVGSKDSAGHGTDGSADVAGDGSAGDGADAAPPVGAKFGVFARLSPAAPPFGMFSSVSALTLDPIKTQNVLDIGATWTRASLSPFYTDRTIDGPGKYDWTAADVVVGWGVSHGIEPVIGIEDGPVQVNTPGKYDPHEIDRYPTADAFAAYCSAAAAHFSAATHAFSMPGNEVNTDPKRFPTVGDTASYMKACYGAVKAADPASFVWGLELNMDGMAGATAYVASLASSGCGPGSCYDGISAHLSLRYPLPPAGTPCYPNPGGDYTVECLADLRKAAGSPVPLMIGETVVTWPGEVPDAATKAIAAPIVLRALAAAPGVRYINYANLDECALYPSGYFTNGCLVDESNAHVPGWDAVHAVFLGK